MHEFRRALTSSALTTLWALFLATGCSGIAETHKDVIRIGYQKAGTLNSLRLRGTLVPHLDPLGVRIEWIGFPAGPQLLEALNAGAIDFGHTGDTPPILRRPPECRLSTSAMSRRGRNPRQSSYRPPRRCERRRI